MNTKVMALLLLILGVGGVSGGTYYALYQGRDAGVALVDAQGRDYEGWSIWDITLRNDGEDISVFQASLCPTPQIGNECVSVQTSSWNDWRHAKTVTLNGGFQPNGDSTHAPTTGYFWVKVNYAFPPDRCDCREFTFGVSL